MNSINEIPVLFFPFSRPQYARKVFDAIKKAKPKKLYFYCDKAREGHEEELKNNNIIREYIKEVDWGCELKTWFRDENIGVNTSILNAIDWFFDNEEMGIILEEDCLPSLAFFDFCRQLLPKYKDDMRVWFISGNNFIEGYNPNGFDYIFSTSSYQWGWATWKSRWELVNRESFNIKTMLEYGLNSQFYAYNKLALYEDEKLRRVMDENGFWNPKSWDYKFQLSMRSHGGLAIIPKHNLVSNIGVLGTNSKKRNKFHNKSILEMFNFIIDRHPSFVVSDIRYNKKYYKALLKKTMLKRSENKLRRIIRYIIKIKLTKKSQFKS